MTTVYWTSFSSAAGVGLVVSVILEAVAVVFKGVVGVGVGGVIVVVVVVVVCVCELPLALALVPV